MAALAAFLGEAPSEAALRRPNSSYGGASRPCSSHGLANGGAKPLYEEPLGAPTPASARRPASRGSGSAAARSEDSSGDEGPDRPPRDDGGFDNQREYEGSAAPVPEALASSTKASSSSRSGYTGAADGAGRTKEQRPPRAPGSSPVGGYGDAGMMSPADSTSSRRGASSGRSGSKPSPKHEVNVLSMTTTPAPSSYAGMMGEEAFDEPPRSGSGQSNRSGSRPQSATRRTGSGSGRDRDRVAEGSPPAKGSPAASALDPFGSSGRIRFGGRG